MIEGDFGGPAPWVTRDGQPVSREKPHGAVVVVFRRRAGAAIELLVLHRSANGAAYEGDWAWGPPAGVRRPGEAVEACAARELLEETGLVLPLTAVASGADAFAVFWAEAPPRAEVVLSLEHDRYEWLEQDHALGRCLPEVAAAEFRAGIEAIEQPT